MKKTLKAAALLICFALTLAALMSCADLIEILLASVVDTSETSQTVPYQTETREPETYPQTDETETETEENVTEPRIEPYVNEYVPSYPGGVVYINKNSQPELFWKSTLKTDRDKTAYESIDKMVKNGKTEAVPGVSISFTDMGRIYTLYKLDHPGTVCYGASYTARGYVNSIDALLPDLPFDKTGRQTAQSKFDSAVNSILSTIPDNASDIEAELIIYDWLCDNVEYDLNAKNAYSAYGALVDKSCVCLGYADAFVYLCSKVGIPAIGVEGIADNGVQSEKHRWCLVKIGGKWYETDPTWGHGHDQERYLYFNNGDYLQMNHYTDKEMLTYLPDSYAEDASYFNYYGLCFGENGFDEAFLRALDRCSDMMSGTPTGHAVLKADSEETAEKYAEMIENESGNIPGLMRRFNAGKDSTYIIYGDTKIVNSDIIIFTVCRY